MGIIDQAKQKFSDAKQLYKLQSQAKAIQKELRDLLIEASSLDGRVSVVFNGEQKLEEIHIDDSLMVAGGTAILEKGLRDAITQALKKSQQVAAEKMKEVAGQLGIPGL
ncbi:MAG: YbaB/EbfC family nucleoid-associated protein [Patescibacteria group bacterium]